MDHPVPVKPDASSPSDAFEAEAGAVLRELQGALAGVIERLRPPVARASQLRRQLKLSQQVSWGLFNAMTARDARMMASLLPGRRAVESFLVAAGERGVSAEVLERARTAFDRFEESVAQHAGSRDAFLSMVTDGAGASAGDSVAMVKHKRAIYRGMSVMWGCEARVVCGARIMHPSETPGFLSTVFIKGMIGVRRTRRIGPLHIAAFRGRTTGPGDPVDPRAPVPLDPRETGPDAIGLLHDFCSQPLPEFRLSVSAQGYRKHELLGERLGAAGDLTYFTGETCRGDTAALGSHPTAAVSIAKSVDVPTEVFIGDLIMHRSTCDARPPVVRVFACPLDGSMELRETDLLPVTERAEYLGEGIEAARTPLIPRYTELLTYAMERVGRKPEEFRVFRCRVDYPVMHTRIMVTLR